MFWKMCEQGMWFEEMVNNREKSVVRDLRWSSDGQKICIAYEDGHVVLGNVDGNRLWGKNLEMQLCFCEWSPDCRLILLCTVQVEQPSLIKTLHISSGRSVSLLAFSIYFSHLSIFTS